MSTTVTLCFDIYNGLQLNPPVVHVDCDTGSHEGIEFLFSLKWVIKFSLKWVTSCHSYVRFSSFFCLVNSFKCLSPTTAGEVCPNNK